jgi:CopG family nickel-responsive transcriptional regulator
MSTSAKSPLVRFGVAMEGALLEDFDRIVEARGVTRSEVLRDLVRAEITRSRVREGAQCVASLTLVYDHHVRDLTERLTEMQHALGDAVRSTLLIHLDETHCLEVIVLSGPADRIRRAAERLLATRGVKQGGIELIALPSLAQPAGEVHEHGGVPHRHAASHEAPAAKKTARPAKKRAHTHGHD